jgi:hypothetical protein
LGSRFSGSTVGATSIKNNFDYDLQPLTREPLNPEPKKSPIFLYQTVVRDYLIRRDLKPG